MDNPDGTKTYKAAGTEVSDPKTDGKGGVFWHTQGSGKSLSMVFGIPIT